MKREEIEKPGDEESRTRRADELCSNDSHQEKLTEELQGLKERLRMVKATATMEELMPDKGDKVGHGVLVGNYPAGSYNVTDCMWPCVYRSTTQWWR